MRKNAEVCERKRTVYTTHWVKRCKTAKTIWSKTQDIMDSITVDHERGEWRCGGCMKRMIMQTNLLTPVLAVIYHRHSRRFRDRKIQYCISSYSSGRRFGQRESSCHRMHKQRLVFRYLYLIRIPLRN